LGFKETTIENKRPHDKVKDENKIIAIIAIMVHKGSICHDRRWVTSTGLEKTKNESINFLYVKGQKERR
jgi:hypothetical protein